MANVVINKEGVPENLRKQLAVTVRSIQWSYAIFWSLSVTQQGVLQWGDGYYNGDIKTRKTVQAMELKADKIGLQRSEQLRQLYESLLEGETDQTKRPSAALSPEDLSDAEWYYLVCMSFVFNPGQGLPGRALANGETIWLCNAQYADSEIFSRSLLAKSASIQTVVCFPYLGGLIELGVTELVPEDPNLLQHIKASLLDFSKPVCSEKSSTSPHNADDDRDPVCAKVDHETVDLLDMENLYSPTEEIKFNQQRFNELHENINEVLNICSPDEHSNGCENRRSSLDVVEQTSGNYENRKVDSVKKSRINKRKVCDIDESHETGSELNRVIPKDGHITSDVKVSMKELEVIIEIRSPSKEFLLMLDIMDAINNLHLDVHTFQSSTLKVSRSSNCTCRDDQTSTTKSCNLAMTRSNNRN